MGDMTKFNSAIEYYIFNVLLMCLLISEIFIFFYTRSKQNRTEKIDTRDLGTKWLLYLNFVFCLIISFLCISQKAPFCIRELTLPAYFAKIGMLITAVGICIRIKAVLTLKKAFTLNVQISKEQQLITNGMYKFVRHPAYTGSILSLLGVSIALKNIPAILIVAICSFVCYQIRINVEEAVFVVDKFLDDCSIANLQTVRIVHGKGTGKLREGIHKFLKSNSRVKSFRVGTYGEGEMGVTVVELK